MQKVIQGAHYSIEKIRHQKYHFVHKRRALKALKTIEAEQGRLPAQVFRYCNEYARDLFGSKHYAPWLYVYSAMQGRFREGWIPDNFYGERVVPAINGTYGLTSNLKAFSPTLIGPHHFPDLAYRMNGRYFDRNFNPIPSEVLADFLFRDHERVIFKMDEGFQGRGVHFFERSSLDLEHLRCLGNGVFQFYLEQHPDFHAFTRKSVTTLRLTTVVDGGGQVSVRAALARIGAPEDTHVRSATNTRVPVDLETGMLFEKGYRSDWSSLQAYPSTGTTFKEFQIRNFEAYKALAMQLHATISYVQCIGWDMVLDANDKIWVMEWNAEHNGIKYSEATQGPCFADLGWERHGKPAMAMAL